MTQRWFPQSQPLGYPGPYRHPYSRFGVPNWEATMRMTCGKHRILAGFSGRLNPPTNRIIRRAESLQTIDCEKDPLLRRRSSRSKRQRLLFAWIGHDCALHVCPGMGGQRCATRCADDFENLNAAHQQRIRDQRTVTAPRDGFRAHRRGWLFPAEFDQQIERLGELPSLHVIGIAAKAGIAPCGVP